MFALIDRPAVQPTLFGSKDPAVDARFVGAKRTWLDDFSWVEVVPGWLSGADHMFHELEGALPWRQRAVRMYDRMLDEPRLVWWWQVGSGARLPSPLLTDMRLLLSIRYGTIFDSIGANFYRNGRDSVAWHRDRVATAGESTIAIVSTGAPRSFLVRPRGGGPSQSFLVGHGDLLTLGGMANNDWEHSVPKVAQAGPRISLVFRHDSDHPHPSDRAQSSPYERGTANRNGHPETQARAAVLYDVSKRSSR